MESRTPYCAIPSSYLTCLHETGHALGLPHTSGFDDIMYNFQLGGNLLNISAATARKLKTHDDIKKYSGLSEADRIKARDVKLP